MKLEDAYLSARDKLGLPNGPFDGDEWHDGVLGRQAIAGLVCGFVREVEMTAAEDASIAEVFERLENPEVKKLVAACYQAAFVKETTRSLPAEQMSADTLGYILRETYDNAFLRAGCLSEVDDMESVARFHAENLAKMVGCEP